MITVTSCFSGFFRKHFFQFYIDDPKFEITQVREIKDLIGIKQLDDILVFDVADDLSIAKRYLSNANNSLELR